MDWFKRSVEAFDSSTAWIDSNWRSDWDYSLRAFRSEHASGSKYLSPEYQNRSRIFSPKTRSIIRKNEAAASEILFGNQDVVNVTPGNPDDVQNVASAAAIKEVLEYRLTKTIPAFELVIGALQDAQTTGVVVSYQYWDYQKRGKKKIDKPCIELRPIENIRLDGGADWLDPVNSSPYFFDIIPMYVCDVRAMMNSTDDKTGAPKWKKFDDKTILKAKPDRIDQLRKSRLGKQQDPEQDEPTSLSEFDLVWVIRCFMRDEEGEDYTYYMLGTEELLTDPKPLEEVYFHGKRPYEMGYAILETHKPIKTSMPVLIRPLQQEKNQIRNSRSDNVQYVLNKRLYVRRGSQTDIPAVLRNAAGGVVLTTNPKEDIIESQVADVTSSAYVEDDRTNSEIDDLAGNFSPATKVANKGMNDTLGGSKMAAAGASVMTNYLIRTFIVSWWEKVLRQLVLLEAEYETDEVVLKVCANKARLFPRFGYANITDDMLKADVEINVNAGIGSGTPEERLQKFLFGFQACIKLDGIAPPGTNVMEAKKEIMSLVGYRDGSRFFDTRIDPRLLMAKQTLQQLTQALKSKNGEIQAKSKVEMAKIASQEKQKLLEVQTDRGRIAGDLQVRGKELQIEAAKLAKEGDNGAEQQKILIGAAFDQWKARLEAEVKLKVADKDAETKIEVAEINAGAKLDAAQISAAEKATDG